MCLLCGLPSCVLRSIQIKSRKCFYHHLFPVNGNFLFFSKWASTAWQQCFHNATVCVYCVMITFPITGPTYSHLIQCFFFFWQNIVSLKFASTHLAKNTDLTSCHAEFLSKQKGGYWQRHPFQFHYENFVQQLLISQNTFTHVFIYHDFYSSFIFLLLY